MPARKTTAFPLRMGPQGRLIIPARLRRALGLKTGARLVCRPEGRGLVIGPRDAIEQELWKRFAAVKRGLAAELIAERRRDAARE